MLWLIFCTVLHKLSTLIFLNTRWTETRFLCSLCCSLISADNSGPVARGKAPFLCSFLDIEISKFRKDLLLFFFFVISWIWFLGKNRLLRKCWVYKTTSSIQLNCNCQHTIYWKILLSKVNRKTLALKSFLTFKKMDPRILPNSERLLL